MSNIMFVSLGIHELNLADAGSLAWYGTDWLWVRGSLINRLMIRTVFLFRLQYPHTVCCLLFGHKQVLIIPFPFHTLLRAHNGTSFNYSFTHSLFQLWTKCASTVSHYG
jgi:hypothetical protein